MSDAGIALQDLWAQVDFKPNPAQRDAILHIEGPLYLPAGPGSGKTRVLLWRTLNLLVFHDVEPEEIYLSTFTEKAARQLKEGLQALLGIVTNSTGRAFDLSPMYVGTIHSLCQRLLTDRRFSSQRRRPRPPQLLDELGQYFFLYRRRNWTELLASVGWEADDATHETITALFGRRRRSRHHAALNCISLFNRLSEECIDSAEALALLEDNSSAINHFDANGVDHDTVRGLLHLYGSYRTRLAEHAAVPQTDFSLIQREAHSALAALPDAGSVFRHVIVDEYQDTNTIQERIFFQLAKGHRNLCVVGDDDQSLYRFRGATVENFVEFPARCLRYLGVKPTPIPLTINYRSRPPIVDFYGDYIDQCNWAKSDGTGYHRVVPKQIKADRRLDGTAVVRTDCGKPHECFEQIADLVGELLQEGRVQDPNQIAFLYPSLKSVQVGRMKEALEARGHKVYAPRAGKFVEVDEATEMFGVLRLIFGRSGIGTYVLDGGGDWNMYRTWLHHATDRAKQLLSEDKTLALYVEDRQADIDRVLSDHAALLKVVQRHRWDPQQPYDVDTMKRALVSARGLSTTAQRTLTSQRFDRAARRRQEEGRPYALIYVLRRATSLDWMILDAFYRICGMSHFRQMLDLAEQGVDEGPICNLSLISQYLRRFMDEYASLITAEVLADNMLSKLLFGSYLFALWRLGESEYEDEEQPFPKGRIPFLTIHQAKGLEFPVVVLANPAKRDRGPQLVETIVRPFLQRDEGEPLDRVSEFDIMRMFYVALSRAQNLLVLAHLRGQGISLHSSIKCMLDGLPTISELDVTTVPPPRERDTDLPRFYSYTSDYLGYTRCPRQYMLFRKYGFEAARTQTAFFGSLIHRTLDDLHNYLIAGKEGR